MPLAIWRRGSRTIECPRIFSPSLASPPRGDLVLFAHPALMSPRLDAALRFAATCHRGQTRRGCDIPYFEHAVAVGWILDRAGFDEEVVIAGLLHDVVEDTPATAADVEERFG